MDGVRNPATKLQFFRYSRDAECTCKFRDRTCTIESQYTERVPSCVPSPCCNRVAIFSVIFSRVIHLRGSRQDSLRMRVESRKNGDAVDSSSLRNLISIRVSYRVYASDTIRKTSTRRSPRAKRNARHEAESLVFSVIFSVGARDRSSETIKLQNATGIRSRAMRNWEENT